MHRLKLYIPLRKSPHEAGFKNLAVDSYATHVYGNSHAGLIFCFSRREQSCDAPVGCGLPGQAPASCRLAGLVHSSTSLPKGVWDWARAPTPAISSGVCHVIGITSPGTAGRPVEKRRRGLACCRSWLAAALQHGDGPNQWSPYEIKLAMALLGKNRHDEMHGIQRRHFNSTAQKVGYAPTVEPIVEELLARTPAAIAEVQAELPQDFSPRVRDAIPGRA